MKYKLAHTGDFIRRAREFGIELRLDAQRTSGFQIFWLYKGDKTKIKVVREAFKQEGIAANHHFKKDNSKITGHLF